MALLPTSAFSASAPRMHSRENIHSLDGLRAVSVLIVAASHCGLGDIVPGGMGVTIFFFLSGYLITRLLSQEYARSHTIGLPAFYVKRFFRLTPPLLALLVLSTALVAVGALSGRITLRGLAAQAFYLTNYYSLFWDTGNTLAGGTGILWSLAVEEHFYFIYPLALIFLLNRYSRRTIFLVLAATCLAVLVWRMRLAGAPGFNSNRTYYATDTRIDSILYGCLLAIGADPLARSAAEKQRTAAVGRWLFGAGALLLVATLVIRSPYFRETYRYSLQGLALLPIFHAILSTDHGWLHRALNGPALARLGRHSYAFYLVHFVVASVLTRNTALGNRPALLLLAVIAISCALSGVIDLVVERPSMRLRNRVLTKLGVGSSLPTGAAAEPRAAG